MEEAAPEVDYAVLDKAARLVVAASVRTLVDGRAAALGRGPTEAELEPVTWSLYERAARSSGGDYAKAMATIHRVGRDLAQFQRSFDLILTPTLAKPPVPLGEIVLSNPDLEDLLARLRAFSPYMRLANAAGVPAASIPLHWNSKGLPIGVQLIARFGEEAQLFRIAAQLEAARPWADRRPLRSSS